MLASYPAIPEQMNSCGVKAATVKSVPTVLVPLISLQASITTGLQTGEREQTDPLLKTKVPDPKKKIKILCLLNIKPLHYSILIFTCSYLCRVISLHEGFM